MRDTAVRLVATVAEHPLDVPFVGLYLHEDGVLRLAASAGAGLPDVVRGDEWGLRSAGPSPTAVPLPPGAGLTGGPFGDAVHEAVVVELPGSGVLLAGVSPSRALDAPYRSFFGLLAQQVAGALRTARAYEEERARAEALAELDRAKTVFFTNVSHEFRTPLTLMLGPLTDAVHDEGAPLSAEQRERVETALRGATRLLKLVNDLLTFSSVEAGSATAARRPVDLAALTAAVASGFRSAVDRGGLRLEVDCPPLPSPAVLDPDHWERIVTNLLSNALKHTFAGRIGVRLTAAPAGALLEVSDTGVGIPAEELPRLFERFHRVSGARARSHEGSGIGLALVRELTALLGGEVDVSSEVGVGTTFRVRVPYGAVGEAALTPVRGAGPGAVLDAAVSEATSWTAPAPARADSDGAEVRVLVADDNADMREHLARLLRAEGWAVETVADGEQALRAALDDPPDLLLTDVMMPGLDGFELLRALRGDPRTATLPVVVLSARAGEGASAEGLDLGADDYVVKPFVSQDLVARLRGTLRLARQRSAHVSQLRVLADAASLVTSGRRLDDALRVLAEQVRAALQASGVHLSLAAGEDTPALSWTAGQPGADDQVLSVPVRGRRGRQLGTLTARLPAAEAARPETQALLPPLTGVFAAVVEEAWHVERDTAVAATLQAFLLPERLPELAGLELAAAYRPAEQDVQVGGDWYDVLELPDGRVAVSVGDVAGQGLTSALVMGQLRTAVRAYALEGLRPSEAVAALDELVARMPGGSLSTMFLGYLDVSTGALTWCSAGHPPPAVVFDGAATWLAGEVTPPLGAAFGVPAVDNATVLPEDARLVLYTDGLVEDRDAQLDVGMPALLDRLAARSAAAPDALVAGVLDDLGPGRSDDTALLVVHRPARPAVSHAVLRDVDTALELAASPQAAGRARRAVRPLLRRAGVDDEVVFELLLGLSEAVNNAVEHPVDSRSDQVGVFVRVDSAARTVRLEVRDSGRWRERRPSMDRGRGATLMAASASVQVLPGADGTHVVLEREV